MTPARTQPPRPIGADDGWATRRLAELLAGISSYATEAQAVDGVLERIRESLGAEVAVLVRAGAVVAARGLDRDAAPDAELAALAELRHAAVVVPGLGPARSVAVDLEARPPGRLLVARAGVEPFAPGELALLDGMARVLALGLQSLDALAAMHRRQALLERLVARQQQIVRRDDARTILDAIVTDAGELLGDDMIALRLIDPVERSQMLVVSSSGLQEDELERMRSAPVGQGIAGRAIQEGELVMFEDYRDEADPGALQTHQRVASAIAAPVREDGRVTGSLVVATSAAGRRYDEVDREAVVALAELASLALTDARIVEQALRRAYHDTLTGLPNRARLAERLTAALQRAERTKVGAAVLFLDLDRFKTINDSLGHAAGDELLVAAAERIRDCIRPTDVAARLGGDEFAVLLEGVGSARRAEGVALRVLTALEAPFSIAGRDVFVSASIGIAVGTRASADLLRDADLAMYHAKAGGRARVMTFEPSMHSAVVERLGLEAELKSAVAGNQLRLHFQPIVDLGGEDIVGLEALVRWEHPERGLVPPSEFVPLAEDIGLMNELGRWVLDEACARAAAWTSPLGEAPGVSVNLSAQQLGSQSLAGDVARALRCSGLAAGRLTLEITETVLMTDMETTLAQLAGLKALGVRLAVDDFGTGYSSLQYLRRFPIDVLKVDKAFVDELTEGGDAPLTRTIVDLGHRLGLTVVAEGIETREQQRRLLELGCTRGQGFLYARPAPASAVQGLLDAARPVTRA